jgi:hypothetical protein
MSYILIFIIITQTIEYKKNAQLILENERGKIISTLLREEKFEEALKITDDPAVSGRIKMLQGKTFEGLQDIEKSALKGDVASTNIFLLSKMYVPLDELKSIIKFEFGIDTNIILSSQYSKYLLYSPESLEVHLSQSDSTIAPFIIFLLGERNLEKNTQKAKEYYDALLDEYQGSIPAIVARNLIRVLEEQENSENY